MGKIGRNDPCPCGSGKKYKKCCLRKDEERIRKAKRPDDSEELFEDEIQTGYELDSEFDQEEAEPDVEECDFDKEERESFHSKTISEDVPEISEQERAIVDEWWRQYKKMAMHPDKVKQHLERFFTAHPDLVPNMEFHHEILFELGAKMVRAGRTEEYVGFMQRIRAEFADSYVKSYGYYDLDIIYYKVASGKKDEVPAYLNYFKEYPDHDPDNLFMLIDFLMATDCGEIVSDLISDIYYPVCVSPKIIGGEQILNPLLMSYYIPFLENGYSEDDLLGLVEQIKKIRFSLVGELYRSEFFKSLFDGILGGPTEWSIADCSTRKEINRRYSEVSLNFMGYLRKEGGMGWMKAEFFRALVKMYLVSVIPEGKRPRKVFTFTRHLIEQTIERRCAALFSLDSTRTLSLLRALYWFAEYLNKSGNISDGHKTEIQSWCSEINGRLFPLLKQESIAAMAFERFPE
jgi:hypothetical protein